MTIKTDALRRAGPFVGNDATTVFPFSFRVFAKTDLLVYATPVAGGTDTALVLDSAYSVTLNPNQESQPGGAITYLVGGVTTPLPSSLKLTILTDVPQTQTLDLKNRGGFYPEVIETAMDRQVVLIQQLEERASRSFFLPPSVSGVNPQLPAPNAGRFLAWDATGTALVNGSPTGVGPGTIGDLEVSSVGAAKVAFTSPGTGGVTRSADAWMRDLINVKGYGAIGDGIANDTVADAAAKSALRAVGSGIVYRPPGAYNVGADQFYGGFHAIDANFPTSFAGQARAPFRADTLAVNGEGSQGFQALSINGTLIPSTIANFRATATPDVVAMSGWGLRGAGGTNPLVVGNFGAWFENNSSLVWATEIDVNNEGATQAIGDDRGGVGVAINTGSTYSPDTAWSVRRFAGAGSGPGFRRGGYIAGSRDLGIQFSAMEAVTYPGMTPPAPGTLTIISSAKSSDSVARFTTNQDGGMAWGPGNAAMDTQFFRSSAGAMTLVGNLNINTGGTFYIGAQQVVGARIGGWGTPVNGARIANFNGNTATPQQTAQVLATLIQDLISHGLEGV